MLPTATLRPPPAVTARPSPAPTASAARVDLASALPRAVDLLFDGAFEAARWTRCNDRNTQAGLLEKARFSADAVREQEHVVWVYGPCEGAGEALARNEISVLSASAFALADIRMAERLWVVYGTDSIVMRMARQAGDQSAATTGELGSGPFHIVYHVDGGRTAIQVSVRSDDVVSVLTLVTPLSIARDSVPAMAQEMAERISPESADSP